MTLAGFLVFGFVLGLRHALEADHVAAVASLTTRETSVSEGVRIGIFWGIGHSFMLFVVGATVLLVDGVVPERLATFLELIVGVMLVVLGLDVWRRLIRDRVHFHVHRHEDGTAHLHAHAHAEDGETSHDHHHPRAFAVRALVVGVMHGMAGSAALVLLTLQKAPSIATGLLYISVFGLGSVLGMALLSTAISLPLRVSAKSLTRFHDVLQGAIGAATIVIGLLLIREMAGVL